MDPIAALAALSVMAMIIFALFAFYGSAMPQSQAVRGRLEGLMSGTSVIDTGPVALRGLGVRTGILSGFAPGKLGERLAHQLERADLTLSPGEFIVLRLALAVVGGIAPIFFLEGVFMYLAVAGGAIAGYNLPKIYMNRRRKQRVDKLNAQLPETLVMVSNSLKAGFGLLQSLNVASDQMTHPISTELARTIHEMNIGSSVEEALLALTERCESYDLDIVVTAVLVQRTVGGNLGEILDNVAETMRERTRIKGEIQTLTAQQKLTGIIIGLLPLGVGILFQFMSPEYIDPLFSTLMGKLMLAVAVVLEVVGILIIQRILDIEV